MSKRDFERFVCVMKGYFILQWSPDAYYLPSIQRPAKESIREIWFSVAGKLGDLYITNNLSIFFVSNLTEYTVLNGN